MSCKPSKTGPISNPVIGLTDGKKRQDVEVVAPSGCPT